MKPGTWKKDKRKISLFEDKNIQTQPLKTMTQFNNWETIIEAWYCVGEISELESCNMFSSQIGNQELIIFRTHSGSIHCLDAFCSHMGLRLNTGSVVEDKLRCKFHHWAYNGEGEVTDSKCTKLSENKNLNSYPVEVRYGLIWIWAGKKAKYSLPYHPELASGEFTYKLGTKYNRPSHPHISLLNALDIQHVNTVHALELSVTANHHEPEDGSFIHYDFQGKFLTNSKAGRRNAWITGGGYQFSVRYAGSTVGFLKALKGIKLLGIIPFPTIYATFGYRQVGNKHTMIQPIFLTPKRKGIIGYLKSKLHLMMTEMIYNRLKNEDGEIYENIRFSPNFTTEDSNIVSFIAHVNRLPKSQF
jgi:phenylpropionate dioxygenase-like ring-hydroxylating dioxygenase large terminal subunit